MPNRSDPGSNVAKRLEERMRIPLPAAGGENAVWVPVAD